MMVNFHSLIGSKYTIHGDKQQNENLCVLVWLQKPRTGDGQAYGEGNMET